MYVTTKIAHCKRFSVGFSVYIIEKVFQKPLALFIWIFPIHYHFKDSSLLERFSAIWKVLSQSMDIPHYYLIISSQTVGTFKVVVSNKYEAQTRYRVLVERLKEFKRKYVH